MKRLLVTIFLTCFLILSFPQRKKASSEEYLGDYKKAETLFERAERLSDKADIDDKTQKRQDQLYKDALTGFEELSGRASKAHDDSLNFHSFIKMGLINHYFDSLKAAKENYLTAIQLKSKLPGIQDSFLFKPYLFLGGILYDEHEFDSASACYQKAEQVQNKYSKSLDESQRLYNKLGAIHYETGNYALARIYFEKALSALSPSAPSSRSLMINYKINVASILVKLEQYDEANKVYESLLPYKIYENEIWHNIGIIDIHLGKFRKAVEDFKKVAYSNNNKKVDLDYNLAVAFSNLDQPDSANLYLQKAFLENKKINGNQKNTAYGLSLKFFGDKKKEEKKYADALDCYQKAIMQFDVSFNDTDIYKNPAKFRGIFSYIHLFNALVAKAEVFEKFAGTGQQTKYLEAALDAFRAAFKLSDYVEKTYESDESRLFLNHIKYSAHSEPIDLCLELYELTKEKKYLGEAYFFDQRNKASILTLNLELQQMQKQPGVSSEIIEKEASLKSAITRLSLKAAQLSDTAQLHQIDDDISNFEIRLSGLQQILNGDARYSQLQPADKIPSVSELQSKILKENTALLSYHLSQDELLILVITRRGFNYYKQAINKNFYNDIQSYLKCLHNVNDEETYGGDSVSKVLYKLLIKPVYSFISHCNRLVIIPDDELNYLPFEALKDGNDHYLLEKFAVQYQYSTALLNIDLGNENVLRNKILAFAPFTSTIPQSNFGILKYSKDEVEGLDGKTFSGKEATKHKFLATANHYGTIHLATHAGADDQFPLKSFIAFYPIGADSNYKLFAPEIYSLRLDSTSLVILSACETGAGQLVRGEGLMSLSRAFAYAGCPNIITSLWKAEDKTTAFITKRLHHYLQKRYSNDEALRHAKLDLVNSDEIEARFKTPNYWAHLVFIGNYEPGKSSFPWLWIAGPLIILIGIFLFLKQKVPQKAGRKSS